jgi:hypothetical protein
MRRLREDAVNQLVAESLMVPLAVIVNNEFGERLSEMPFAQRDDAIEAFFFHGAHEALRMRVAIRCLDRCLDYPNTC